MDTYQDNRNKHIINYLIENEFINYRQGSEALEKTAQGGRLREYLESNKMLADASYPFVAGFLYMIPIIDMSKVYIQPLAVSTIPENLAQFHRALPIDISKDGKLRLACEDILSEDAYKEIQEAANMNLRISLSSVSLALLINQHYRQ